MSYGEFSTYVYVRIRPDMKEKLQKLAECVRFDESLEEWRRRPEKPAEVARKALEIGLEKLTKERAKALAKLDKQPSTSATTKAAKAAKGLPVARFLRRGAR